MGQEEKGGKSPFTSKTLHFNVWSGILAQAVWPFLPQSFRDHDYAHQALIAWLTVGNIILRFATTEALSLYRGKNEVSE